MRQSIRHLQVRFLIGCCLCQGAFAQTPLTWQQVKDKFAADNPNLRAGQLNIQESRAQEVTAFLRPNPNFTGDIDQFYTLLNGIAKEGLVKIETVAPADDDANAIYQYLIGSDGSAL